MRNITLLLIFLLAAVTAHAQNCECIVRPPIMELDTTRFVVELRNGRKLQDCRSIMRMVDFTTGKQDLLLCFHNAPSIRLEYADVEYLVFSGLGAGTPPYRTRVGPARLLTCCSDCRCDPKVPSPWYVEPGVLAGRNVAMNYKEEPGWFAAGQLRFGRYLNSRMLSMHVGIEAMSYRSEWWFPVTVGVRAFFTRTIHERYSEYLFASNGKGDPRCAFGVPGDTVGNDSRLPDCMCDDRTYDREEDYRVFVYRKLLPADRSVRWFLSFEGGLIVNNDFGLEANASPALLNPEDRSFPLLLEAGIGFVDGGDWMLNGLVVKFALRYMRLYHEEGTDCPGCVKTLLVNHPIHGMIIKIGYQF